MTKIQIRCKHCNSTNVVRDAWAEWDIETQKWVLGSVFDAAFCMDCDGESSLIEEELA